jgi:RimJ/RimL family protein N-acetyltransferase
MKDSIIDNCDAEWILSSTRLTIRRAKPNQQDISLLFALWYDPEVMRNVGFPSGLKTSPELIARQLRKQKSGEFDCVLVVMARRTTELVGQCKLGSPDASGVAHTDIKLLPGHWGIGYGKEIKLTLLEYLFTHTTCRQVRATPNKHNIASIRLQESVGGRKTGEGVHRFPESMKAYTNEVPFLEYTVFREDWVKALSS